MRVLKISTVALVLGLSLAFVSIAPKAVGASSAAQFVGQSDYPTVLAGESASAYITYRNAGSEVWYDSSSTPTSTGMANLATANPINRTSALWRYSADWQSPSRPAIYFDSVYEADGTLASNQHVVQPDQMVKYQFDFYVPTDTKPGIYREWFQPVLDGSSGWDIGGQAWLDVTVLPTTFQATLLSTPSTVSLTPGQTQSVTLRYKNTGTGNIKDTTGADDFRGPFGNLATSTTMNRTSLFAHSDWRSQGTRPAINFAAVYEANGTTLASNQHVARAGQIFTYTFNLTAHPGMSDGTYREWFQPVLDNAPNWDMGGQAYVDVVLSNSSSQVQYHSQSSYPTISAGSSTTGHFMFKNIGSSPLFDSTSIVGNWGMANLATSNDVNRPSLFGYGWNSSASRPAINFAAVYEANGTTLASNQHVAQPGQIVKYQFNITAPVDAEPGTYREWFQPVLDGAPNWEIGGRVFLDVTIIQ